MEALPLALYTTLEAELMAYSHPGSFENVLRAPIIIDNDTVACSSLLNSILKKYVPSHQSSVTSERAKALFRECNDHCYDTRPSSLIHQMRYIAESDFPNIPCWLDLLDYARTGPGASVHSNNRNSMFEKLFINRMSTTSDILYGEYRRYIRKYPDWREAEQIRIVLAGERYSVVSGSNLSTVPKNSSIDRVICTEPSLNMFFQLALGEYINSRMYTLFRYDAALQPDRNREHARTGSVDGITATIDLKSASDTISLSLCEAVLPSELFAAIMDCRSPSTSIDGEIVPLKMVSSMGNGFTFPLQTYLFSLCVRATCLQQNVRFEHFDVGNFGVFGDDIIIPSSLYESVVCNLETLGFTVNTTKSYWGSHPFRESCGCDYYDGRNVRGVYATDLSTDASRYSLANRLNRWSARHRIPLPRTLKLLLPSRWRSFTIPSDMSDDAGYKTPNGTLSIRGTYRYNYLSVKRTIKQIFLKSGDLRALYNNPTGLLLMASCGRLSSSGIAVRPFQVNYIRSRGSSPFWSRKIDIERHSVPYGDWGIFTDINTPY